MENNKRESIKTPKQRDALDLLELVCQLHTRGLNANYATKELHDAYVEARQELESRIAKLPIHEPVKSADTKTNIKKQIIHLIDSYWRFDSYQQPNSSWHEKQDLIGIVSEKLEEYVNQSEPINQKLLEALKKVYDLIDKGHLVRDISKDDDYSFFIKQSLEITNAITLMNEAIQHAEQLKH